MKVLAINGSPRMNESNTSLILNPFLEGMTEEGAEVELLYTRMLNINPCEGERYCSSQKPGECFQQDEMQAILSKLRQADVWVFATPVYWGGMTGPMKNLVDRMVPLLQPPSVPRDSQRGQPPAEGSRRGKVVLVSQLWLVAGEHLRPSDGPYERLLPGCGQSICRGVAATARACVEIHDGDGCPGR